MPRFPAKVEQVFNLFAPSQALESAPTERFSKKSLIAPR